MKPAQTINAGSSASTASKNAVSNSARFPKSAGRSASVRAGDVLLGIASSGPHSNGYSLVRRIFDRAGRPAELDVGGVRLIDALMAPTTIYVKPMLALFAKHAIHASAHITGGGLTENIIRVIPDGLGLDIEASAVVLPPVFDWLQREGAVPREEMWRTFNCGVGFVLVLAPGEVAAVSASLDAFGLAHRPIGAVVPRADGERVRFLG